MKLWHHWLIWAFVLLVWLPAMLFLWKGFIRFAGC